MSCRDHVALITFFCIIFFIPAALWHPKMLLVSRAIVLNQDDSVSASELRFLKRHFGSKINKKNCIVNMHCFDAYNHDKCCVRPRFDLMLD